MPSLKYGTTSIQYYISYKEGKNDVTISVDRIEGVHVIAPPNVNGEKIDEVLRKKAPWILGKLNEISEIRKDISKREFLSGEKLPYLGRNYRLKIITSPDSKDATVVFHNGRFVAMIPHGVSDNWRQARLRNEFKKWYIEHGHQKIQERLRLFCPRMECYPTKIIVKEQENRWGSCTKNGTININWRILMAPMRVVDYVIVHELAHLKYPDHSFEFWNTVQAILPDYDNRKEWLRIHGPTLTF